MGSEIACTCGRRLRVREELAGKRVKCPACGAVLTVPQLAAAPSPEIDDDEAARSDEHDDEVEERPKPDRPARRKRKKKKTRKLPSLSLGGFPGIAIGNPKLIFGALIAAGVIAGMVYFLMPGPAYQVLEVQAVDAIMAFDGLRHKRQALMQPGLWEKGEADLRLGGSGRLMVVRDNPEGNCLLVRLKVRHKFLNEHGAVQHGTISLRDEGFQLLAEANPITSVLLTEELPNKAEVDFFLAPNEQQILPPLGPGPEGIQLNGERTNSVKTRFDKEKSVIGADGKADFKSPTGLQVQYIYAGSLLTMTWDPRSRGWLAERNLLGTEDVFNKLEVTCLFRRPAASGDWTIRVLGGPPVAVRLK